MKNQRNSRRWLGITSLALLSSTQFASAVNFTFSGTGDVLLGFRRTQANYELVVNAGNITNFLNVSAGSSIAVSGYSPGQLTDAFPGGYTNLQWSVFSPVQSAVGWTNSFGVFPKSTVWYTLPGTNVSTQTTPPTRITFSGNAILDQRMQGVGNGAAGISLSLNGGVTNADNNSTLIREPVTLDGAGNGTLNDEISDQSIPSFGDFGGSAIDYTVENVTPGSFTTAQRSDLYQSVASSKSGQTFIDPITGTTNGPAYFVGYFLLSPSGTMTFTRATVSSGPPPAPTLSITRTNNTSTISFNTTNGATYNLIYTTGSGLTTARSTWTPVGSSITGNGGHTNFADTSADPSRFYSVTAH